MSFVTQLACLAATATVVQVARAAEWYEEMKIGPAWSNTFEDTFQGTKRVAALKGILLDLGDNHRALFDTETLRLVTAYQGKFKWGGTPWTGQHGPLISLADENAIFNTPSAPGWADSGGSFEDKREIPGFGNLKDATYKGYYRSGSTIVLQYAVNGTDILEVVSGENGTITRTFLVAARTKDLILTVADEKGNFTVSKDKAKSADGLGVTTTGGITLNYELKTPGHLLAKIPKGAAGVFQIALARGTEPKAAAAPDIKKLITGGAPLYPEIVETKGTVSSDKESPYVTDVVTLPNDNPWKSNLRFGGFDFIDEDSAALSSWNGDVWVVKGLKGDWSNFKWQRIASGLFETLGVKVVDGKIFVNGRDQITELVDLNGDGETDYFKVFNRDVIISPNFHEFAFELQTDKAGNFYFSKASPVKGGGRGFDRILPNNGTIVKISPDGKKSEIVATGLRAPGGLGVGPNGELTTGENEGTNQPACKINYTKPGKPVFFGTEASRQFLKSAPYTEPLCYLPMSVDNSGASQVWVPEGANFGVAAGTMLHLSYGQSTVYEVLPVPRKNGSLQGGVVKLPITLQSSAMRARFQKDGSLYLLGFRGWQTNAATECAFQRVRHNADVVVPVPEKMEYTPKGIRLKFPSKLDKELAEDPTSYGSERWNYVRGPQYGSGEFSVDRPDKAAEEQALTRESKDHNVHDTVKIDSARLLPDGQTVELELAGMKPCMTLKVTYDLENTEGGVIKGAMYGTVYKD
ncbi:hypothetical protein JIN84_16825 [Luteolibacter yonseiensis]|uniref:DUF6797 domain-containing protein n=1 Tax=Luteolibacter yonseiensis TaxID=1144680 RepID=A0A934R509_9BACT|nr:DUF6797 domain-containing protein [Luteolibacter yonseiensis]MBK1817286.1 hypothetical protein [Luteolibacter yonseiensis]